MVKKNQLKIKDYKFWNKLQRIKTRVYVEIKKKKTYYSKIQKNTLIDKRIENYSTTVMSTTREFCSSFIWKRFITAILMSDSNT